MKFKLNNQIIKHLIFTVLLFCLFLPLSADLITPLSSGYNLELSLKPEYPTAYQTASAQIVLYGLDIERYEIAWFVNGVLKDRKIGQTEFFFQVGDWGKTTTLAVQVSTPQNGVLTKQLQIIPVEVDLVWETDTFTPPFYKGKAINSSNAVINITALPNFVTNSGQKIDADKLIYRWTVNSKVMGNQSGYGKKTFSLEGPQTNQSKDIKVEVESIDGNLRAQKIISLRSQNPQIIFYKEDPLLGTLYNKAIKNEYNLIVEELRITAVPFFISPQDNTLYKWIMNNQVIENDLYKEKLVLRQPTDQTGQSNITLKIQNMDRILQFAEKSFLINFEN